MPDAGGRFKGISVPRIPWHDKASPPGGRPETQRTAASAAGCTRKGLKGRAVHGVAEDGVEGPLRAQSSVATDTGSIGKGSTNFDVEILMDDGTWELGVLRNAGRDQVGNAALIEWEGMTHWYYRGRGRGRPNEWRWRNV